MTLVERLEALAKQKSRRLGEQLVQGGYRVEMADERDTLEEAAKYIRASETGVLFFMEAGTLTDENFKNLSTEGYITYARNN